MVPQWMSELLLGQFETKLCNSILCHNN